MLDSIQNNIYLYEGLLATEFNDGMVFQKSGTAILMFWNVLDWTKMFQSIQPNSGH